MHFQTIVVNPTNVDRKYVWLDKKGKHVPAKGLVTVDYEPWSAADRQSKKQLEEDLAAGVVKLKYVTDVPTTSLTDEMLGAPAPKAVDPKDGKSSVEDIKDDSPEEIEKAAEEKGEPPPPPSETVVREDPDEKSEKDETRESKTKEMYDKGIVDASIDDLMVEADEVFDPGMEQMSRPPVETQALEDAWDAPKEDAPKEDAKETAAPETPVKDDRIIDPNAL